MLHYVQHLAATGHGLFQGQVNNSKDATFGDIFKIKAPEQLGQVQLKYSLTHCCPHTHLKKSVIEVYCIHFASQSGI